MPQRSINAVIATEDRSFWTNDGIDLGAVFRAFVTNVTSGEIEQGGSTITQQLVKNRILTPKRDVNRKVKEIEDALRLNEKFSKEKILEEYLNTVYFGQNSYGIKARGRSASSSSPDRRAFGLRGKRLDELTIGEAALLAGVISNPKATTRSAIPTAPSSGGPTCCAARSSRATSRRPRPTPPTTSRCPPSLPPAELRPSSYLVAEVQDQLLDDTRARRHARRSGATSCSRAG